MSSANDVHAREADAAMESVRVDSCSPETEARLQLALDASGLGTFVWHIQDDRCEPDRRARVLFGLPADGPPLTKGFSALIHPDECGRYAEAVARATDPDGTGVMREEVRGCCQDGEERWLAITGQTLFEIAPAGAAPPIGSRRAVRMSGIVADVTDRKRREANRSFLADVAHDFARLSSAEEILQVVGEKAGAHLKLSCSCLVEVDELRDEAHMAQVWRAKGIPHLSKIVRLSDFVTRDFHEASRAGDTIVVSDTVTDARVDAQSYAAVKTRAFISVPFIRDGALKYLFTVCDAHPRQWREDEVRLCRELSIRLLPRLERARAEQAVANDLRDMRLLRDLSVRLVSEADEHSFFDAIVAAAVAITGATAGSIHLLDPETRELSLLATQGVPGEIRYAEPGQRSAQFTPLVTRAGRTIGMLSTYVEDGRRLSERELRFLDLLARQAAETIERRRTDDALRESERRLSAELADTKLLQMLSAQLIKEQDSMSLYETIVDAATSIMRSEHASLQKLHPDRGAGGELQLIASRGFTAEAKQYWQWVSPKNTSSCAAALRTGVRVLVPDIRQAEFMTGSHDQAVMLAGGILAMHSTPLVSRSGKMLGMISTHWREPHQASERDLRLMDILARQAADLMERTQAEDALRRSERELKDADRRKDEFLAVLAHELRNPLAPLRTGLELIRLGGDTPAAVHEIRTMMEEQVGHMVRLIDDLLDVSRITSGKIKLKRQATPLVNVVQAAVEANQAALDAGYISLGVDLPGVAVSLDADPTRVVQVLSNILHNAVKFTEPGGRIKISARVEEPGDGQVKNVVLIVADSGVGISQEMLPRVFDLFTQDDAAARGSDPGLGIGLALARQLIEMHGGSIGVESDGPGLGSAFTLRWPVSKDATVPRPATPAGIPRIDRRVVVVDDNIPAANAMNRLVTALGGECRVAYDGETGIEQVLSFCPDLVFLDIGMPGMDGYETCRRIREEVGRDIVIVALTGWGQERDKEESMRAGFDVHLAKPADPMVLEKLLAATNRSPRHVPDRETA